MKIKDFEKLKKKTAPEVIKQMFIRGEIWLTDKQLEEILKIIEERENKLWRKERKPIGF